MIAIKNLIPVLTKASLLYRDTETPPVSAKSMEQINALLAQENIKGRNTWTGARRIMAAKQILLRDAGMAVGEIDGFYGPVTEYAMSVYNGTAKTREQIQRENSSSVKPSIVLNNWPRQVDVPKFYGAIGKNQTQVAVPWAMTYDGKPVSKITIHEKCAESLKRVLARIRAEHTDAELVELGLNIYGGSYNPRKMRGGNEWSMHAYSIAIDFDPERNKLEWGRDRARLAKPDAEKFWKAWEDEGWISLGRQRNFDWMHVQAARL